MAGPWRKYNWKGWNEILAEWKYFNPEATSEEKFQAVRGCASKFAFRHFLEAMKAANRMSAELGCESFGIYHCCVCHMEHIGRNRKNKKTAGGC